MADDENEEIVLDDHDKYLISIGREPKGGNGSWAPITSETHSQYVEAKRKKQQAIKMARLEGYVQANREFAYKLFQAKSGMVESLYKKATESGEFDIDALSSSEQNMLLKVVESVENRAFGSPTQRKEQTGQVNIIHKIAEWKNQLGTGDE